MMMIQQSTLTGSRVAKDKELNGSWYHIITQASEISKQS